MAEDIGRQIITTGRRMNPAEVERVVGAITEKDVMAFANERIWDQDVAVSALGSIEGVSFSFSFSVCVCEDGVLMGWIGSCWITNVSVTTLVATFRRGEKREVAWSDR